MIHTLKITGEVTGFCLTVLSDDHDVGSHSSEAKERSGRMHHSLIRSFFWFPSYNSLKCICLVQIPDTQKEDIFLRFYWRHLCLKVGGECGGDRDSSNYVLTEKSVISASGLFETQSFPIYSPFVEVELNSMKGHILFPPGGSLVLYFSSVW